MLKRVGVKCSRLDVCEDDKNYSMSLARLGDDDVTFERMSLYRVRLCTAIKTVERFVVAESQEAACSQTTCGLKPEEFGGVENLERGILSMNAERVPFLIRGWGSQEF